MYKLELKLAKLQLNFFCNWAVLLLIWITSCNNSSEKASQLFEETDHFLIFYHFFPVFLDYFTWRINWFYILPVLPVSATLTWLGGLCVSMIPRAMLVGACCGSCGIIWVVW